MPWINREQQFRLRPWLPALVSQLCIRTARAPASRGAGKAQVCCSSALPPQTRARASPQEQGAAPGTGVGSPPGEDNVPLPPAIPHTTTSPWGTTTSPYQDSAPCCEEEGSFSFLGLPALPLTLCSLLPSHPFPLTLVSGPLPSLRSISEVPC